MELVGVYFIPYLIYFEHSSFSCADWKQSKLIWRTEALTWFCCHMVFTQDMLNVTFLHFLSHVFCSCQNFCSDNMLFWFSKRRRFSFVMARHSSSSAKTFRFVNKLFIFGKPAAWFFKITFPGSNSHINICMTLLNEPVHDSWHSAMLRFHFIRSKGGM